MRVTVLTENVVQVRSEILVLGLYEDARPIRGYLGAIDWFSNGMVSSLIQQGKLSGRLGEVALFATPKVLTPKILLMGLGPKGDYGYSRLEQIAGQSAQILRGLQIGEAVVELWGQADCALDLLHCLDVVVRSMRRCLADRPVRRTPFHLTILTPHADRVRELVQRVEDHQKGWPAGVSPEPSSGKGMAGIERRVRHDPSD